ncbi:MAG: sigma 54-interacting transcriptional regulator [Candidatus Binataceae bacterium]
MIEGGLREREATARVAVLDRLAQLATRYPGDGLLALDERGRILSVSPPAQGLLSLPTGELLGRRADDVPSLREHIAKARQQEGSTTIFPVASDHPCGTVILLRSPARGLVAKKKTDAHWAANYQFADLVGRSPAFGECRGRAERASLHSVPVLLPGESGTGKEMFAQAIHNGSTRRAGSFVALNCANFSDELMGVDLFGYEEGSFTGGLKGGKVGKIQLADGGTLFLDEVDVLSARAQAGLLRVPETGQVIPIGGTKPVDLRIIAASNNDIEAAVSARKFRLDWYHRLRVFAIPLPPLRERPGDVRLLTRHILSRGAGPQAVSEEALQKLERHAWPGNVRELANVLAEAAIMTSGECIDVADLPVAVRRSTSLRLQPLSRRAAARQPRGRGHPQGDRGCG